MKESMSELLYMYWDVGSHIPFFDTITETVFYGITKGMYTIQFFMGDNKQAWKREKISDKDIEETMILIDRFPLHIFTHYPFCANLAGQAKKGCLAWNGDCNIDRKLQGVMRSLEYELGIMAKLSQKRSGVVIHPGSYPDRDDGHNAVAKTLNRIDFPKNGVLLLENCAGEGNKLCRTFTEIQSVFNLLHVDKKKHVKVCIDTAHIWGQGDYDLRKIQDIDKMFDDFEKIIGIEHFYLLHLNDSEVPLGSKKDVHACLGKGMIWKDSFESLIYLLNKCKEKEIPMVLETDCSDMITLSNLQPTDF
jgi:apurinic endonuclease APN1